MSSSNLQTGIVAASGTYTATQTSGPQQNLSGAKGVKLFVNIAANISGAITPTIYYTDQAGIDYTALQGTSTSSGQHVYTIYPALAAVANVTANDVIPKNFHIDTIATSGQVTYSANYILIP